MDRRQLFTGAAALAVAASVPAASFAATDPALSFIDRWNDLNNTANAMEWEAFEAFYKANVFPIEKAAKNGAVPPAQSAEGAAAMLRKALSWDDMEDMDANLVRSALAYLEGASL